MFRNSLHGCVSFITLIIFTTAAPAADPLSQALESKGKEIIAVLQKAGHTNVGVLKFLVRHGDGPLRDNAGDLNLSLANKTELAIALANRDKNFGVFAQASQAIVDMKLRAANHLDEDGRKAFFRRKFTIPWSGDQVVPAAFVTGVATVSQNNSTLKVHFQYFDKTGTMHDLPGDVLVPLDAKTLAEAGLSYAMSAPMQKAFVSGGPPPKREVLEKEAVKEAQLPPEKPKPLAKPEAFAPLAASPVKLTLLSNGVTVPISSDLVPEPKEKDKIAFLLENPGPGTYAVVLLVNGVNTLYHETAAVEVCRKWVLPPNASVLIQGFQTDAAESEQFKVLPPTLSDEASVNYGNNAGTFRMVVFHGQLTEMPIKEEKLEFADAGRLAIARTRGTSLPVGIQSKSLEAYQADLRGRYRSGDGSRGLIVKSNKKERFETQQVTFQATSDVPVADISLRYYKPRDEK